MFEQMAQIIWTELALLDLNEIAECIALDKPSAAIRLVHKVFSSTDRLEQFPESGRKPTGFKKIKILGNSYKSIPYLLSY